MSKNEDTAYQTFALRAAKWAALSIALVAAAQALYYGNSDFGTVIGVGLLVFFHAFAFVLIPMITAFYLGNPLFGVFKRYLPDTANGRTAAALLTVPFVITPLFFVERVIYGAFWVDGGIVVFGLLSGLPGVILFALLVGRKILDTQKVVR